MIDADKSWLCAYRMALVVVPQMIDADKSGLCARVYPHARKYTNLNPSTATILWGWQKGKQVESSLFFFVSATFSIKIYIRVIATILWGWDKGNK